MIWGRGKSARRRWALLIALAAGLAWIGACRRPQGPSAANYGRPFEPPRRPAFIPLPPGAVEPEGWLRDWALAARDGYTGHMDEIDQAFRQAWAADYKMTGDELSYWDRGAWPYEGGGYWLEGLIKLGYCLHDDALIAKAKARLDVVVANIHENSLLFMWWLDKNNPRDVEAAVKQAGGEAEAWPVWANGLMGRALAAYYAGSGDPRVLRALETAYGGSRLWSRKGWALSNIWPAYETWTWTGNAEIQAALDDLFNDNVIEEPERNIVLYRSWYNRRPDENLAWYRQPDHGVHFNESVIPWAIGRLWTGKPEFLEAPLRWYEIIERGDDGMQPYGVPVWDENSGPTGSWRGTETCDVAAYMWSRITLLRVGRRGSTADRTERAFFNAAPATVSRDFMTHVYDQSPNRTGTDAPSSGAFQYQKTHWPLCCSASLNRILPNYITSMWMATYDNGLAAVHYGPCNVSALVADRVPVQLACRTDYPFNEFIDIGVSPDREARFPLVIRIPEWCAAPTISVNGSNHKAVPDADGFVRIDRSWRRGDKVRLRFPMAVRVGSGHDNDAGDTPYATVSYGPLLFALGIPDTADANTPEADFQWNYALDAGETDPAAGISVERRPMPSVWSWQLDAPLRLRIPVRAFGWNSAARRALQTQPVAPGEASPFQPDRILTNLPPGPIPDGRGLEEISLVPYGCTKFRVSMFPVTQRAWKALNPAR